MHSHILRVIKYPSLSIKKHTSCQINKEDKSLKLKIKAVKRIRKVHVKHRDIKEMKIISRTH